MIYAKAIFIVMFKHRNIINLIVKIMIHKFNNYKSMVHLNIS